MGLQSSSGTETRRRTLLLWRRRSGMKRNRRECEAKEARERHLPICKEHVARGLKHVLTLSVKNSKPSDLPDKTQILKHVFNHLEAKSGLRKERANDLLTALITALEGVTSQNS